jgi:hypothetical protein
LDIPVDLQACNICNRTFSPDVLVLITNLQIRHLGVCKLSNKKQSRKGAVHKYASMTEPLDFEKAIEHVSPDNAKPLNIAIESTINSKQIPVNDNLYMKVEPKQIEKEYYFEGNDSGIPENLDLTDKLEPCQICNRSFLADRLVLLN